MSSFDQSALDKLSTQLRGFTEGMSEFISKGGFTGSGKNTGTDPSKQPEKISANFDKSTQKIVNALGALSAVLTSNNKTKTQQTAYIDKFTKSIEKATEAQEEKKKVDDENLAHIKTVLDWQKKTSAEQKQILDEKRAAKEKEKTAKEKQSREEQLSALTNRKNSSAMAESLLDARFASDVFASKLSKSPAIVQVAVAGLGAAVKGAAAGITEFSSAIYKGDRSTATAINAISSASTPLIEFGKTVGSAMMALGGFASWLGRFLPGWGKLAQFAGKGAVVLGGALYSAAKYAELYIKLQKLGAEQTDKLLKSYNTLSQSGLSTAGGIDDVKDRIHELGMSISEVENFTKLLTGSSKDLALMGNSASAGAKEFTKVGKEIVGSDLGRSLRLMGVTADEQREAALLYMSIQAKTGQRQKQSTDQLVKGTGDLLKEMDAMAQLTGTSVAEQKKIKEMANADDQWQAAMDDAIAADDQQAIINLKNYRKAGEFAAKLGDMEGAKGAFQQGASPHSTEIGTKFSQTYLGGQALDSTKELTDEDIRKLFSAGMKSTYDRFAGAAKNLEGGIKGTGMTTIGSAQLSKQRKLVDDKSLDQIGLEQAARQAQGGRTAAAIDAGIKMESAAQIQDNAVFKFNNAANISLYASEKFEAAVDGFAEFLGSDGSIFKKRETIKDTPAAEYGSTGGGAATGIPSMSAATTQGNSNIRPGSGRDIAAKANAERARQSPTGGTTGNMTDYLKKIAVIESSGKSNAKAKTSSASGLFQFTEDTWKDTVKNMRKNYSLNDRFDPVKSAEVAEYFTRKQKEQLEKGTKRSANDVDMYLAHFLGAGGATKFLNAMHKNPNNPSSEGASAAQIKANPSIFLNRDRQIRSLQEVYDLMSMKIRGAESQISSGKVTDEVKAIGASSTVMKAPEPATPEARTGGIFKGPSTGYTVELHGDEAVVPMNEGVSKQALNTSVFNQDTSMIRDMMSMFETMQYKYDQMIDLLSRQADNGDKLVQAAY